MPKKNNNFFKLEMLFLKILSIRDCYGYEITHSIKELTNGKIDIKEGSMYPVLYKFEDLGYISSEKKLVDKNILSFGAIWKRVPRTHIQRIQRDDKYY